MWWFAFFISFIFLTLLSLPRSYSPSWGMLSVRVGDTTSCRRRRCPYYRALYTLWDGLIGSYSALGYPFPSATSPVHHFPASTSPHVHSLSSHPSPSPHPRVHPLASAVRMHSPGRPLRLGRMIDDHVRRRRAGWAVSTMALAYPSM